MLRKVLKLRKDTNLSTPGGDLYPILFLTPWWVYPLSLHFVHHSYFLCFFSYTSSYTLHDHCRKIRTDQEAKRKQRLLIIPLPRNTPSSHCSRFSFQFWVFLSAVYLHDLLQGASLVVPEYFVEKASASYFPPERFLHL